MTRKQIAAKLREERMNQPSRSSEEAYAQMDRANKREPKQSTERDLTDKLADALEKVLRYADINLCRHEETHRGGAIWTICDQCGRKWADDEGGFKPQEDPEEFTLAHQALDAYRAQRDGKRRRKRYQALKGGDVIQAGDQVKVDGVWEPSICVGDVLSEQDATIHRRPLAKGEA